MNRTDKTRKRGFTPSGGTSRNAAAILREQETESELEELWLEGPAVVNEQEPPSKRFLIF